VLRALDRHAVPVGRIYVAKDMLEDPQFTARQSIVEVPDGRPFTAGTWPDRRGADSFPG